MITKTILLGEISCRVTRLSSVFELTRQEVRATDGLSISKSSDALIFLTGKNV